ncbi:MAG: PP2C family protein-serine/threonine phosphatase, partial [Cyanobacteria bacterium NC_groundwater_1444_Ag_S-0.65um_54_12]|nr:PP2C family protein-serine/threonine phosphatase [Cyanobacteria bacterium NC_groundwater_1444_Ag_S-0.65um_54_12]
DTLIRNQRAGTAFDYRIYRDGSYLSLRIPSMAFTAVDIFSMFVMWWLLGVVFLGLGTFVAVVRPGDPAARAFLLFCLVFALFSLTNFESVTTRYFSWPNILALAFGGSAACHLALRMPRTPGFISTHPALTAVPFLPGFALAGLTLIFYQQPALWKPIYLADTVLMGLGLLALPVAAAVTCWHSASDTERAQGALVLAGASSGIVPTLVVTLAALVGISIPGSEAAYLLTLLFPAALAYAIVRWRLFHVEVVIKRTLVYALLTATLATSYFVITAGLMALWGASNARWVDVLAAAAVAVIFAPLRDRTKTVVDRLFFRQGYELGRSLSDFAERARRTFDPQDLLSAYAVALEESLHPQELAVFLKEGNRYVLRWGELPKSPVLRVPMRLKEETGVVFLGPRRSDLPYKAIDRQLINNLSGQLALWLENAALFAQVAQQERIRRELEIAREVQAGFLPGQLPDIAGVAIAACTYPALEVGGDFYDVLPVDDRYLAILVGDVSGKGVPAALLMAMTVMIFRSLVKGDPSPAAVLTRANDLIALNRPSKKMFVTAFYALLDRHERTLVYANAGQPFPITSTGSLQAKGMALGVIPCVTYEEFSRQLVPGETIMFYSDGAEDAINPQREFFGRMRLENVLSTCWDKTPSDAQSEVLRTIREFAGETDPYDDITLLTVQVA